MTDICVLSTLYRAETAAEAARYAASLANHAACGRLCLLQLSGGGWAVCVCRGGGKAV